MVGRRGGRGRGHIVAEGEGGGEGNAEGEEEVDGH